MSWLGDYIKSNFRYQFTNLESVKIAHKFNSRFNKFYIDSAAGLIIYRAKNQDDLTRFRDKWINQAELLRQKEAAGQDVRKELFKLYAQIRREENVSYEANINTRMRSLCSSIL